MTEQRAKEEKLARKIRNTLNGLCPSFERAPGSGIEWHYCHCKITGSACSCVWHIQDTCVAGKWEKLSFVNRHIEKKTQKREKYLIKAQEAASNSNIKESKIDDRFEILDL